MSLQHDSLTISCASTNPHLARKLITRLSSLTRGYVLPLGSITHKKNPRDLDI